MNKYEIVYIFPSSLTAEEFDSKLQKFHALLTRDGGQITAVEHWGKRQLAYPIEKERNGYYVVAQFEVKPGSLPDFERSLKLDDQLLRYLIVLSEGELPTAPSMRRDSEEGPGRAAVGVGPRSDEDDDDEDDDDEDEDEDDYDDEIESVAEERSSLDG